MIKTYTIQRSRKRDSFNAISDDMFVSLESCSLIKNFVLEIGSGNGENIARVASAEPNVLHIASEVYIDGIVQTVRLIEEAGLKNVKLFNSDALYLLEALSPCSISTLFIICPDPWPKTKQKKRRIISESFFKLLEPKLAHGADILISTDHFDYAKHMCKVFCNLSLFDSRVLDLGFILEDYTKLPESKAFSAVELTKYQRKGIKAGRDIFFFHINNSDGLKLQHHCNS